MKIKIYNSNVQRQAPLGKAMATPESLGAGVAQAASSFGDTAFNVFNEAERKDQILKANTDLSDFELGQRKILNDMKRDAPLDGNGVYEKFNEQYQKKREELLKDKGRFYQEAAGLKLDSMKNQYEADIIDYEARQNILKRSSDVDKFTENQATFVRQNPAEFQARYNEAIRNIDNARLPPDVRLQQYDRAKKALKQAPIDHIKDMISTNPTGALSLLDTEEYKNLIGDPQKTAELKRETETFLIDVDSRKKKLYDAMNPEEAQARAITQTVNNNSLKEKWNDKKEGLKKKGGLFEMFEYRNTLSNKLLNGEISEKDYAERVAETVDPLVKKSKERPIGGTILWNNNFDEAIQIIDRKIDTKNMPDNVRAAVYDIAYSMFKEKGIDPSERIWSDDKAEIVAQEVAEKFIKMREPALVGIEANKVLFGTKVYDYKKGESKKIQPSNYEVYQDANGALYKVYKDKEGNYSNDSIKERIIK